MFGFGKNKNKKSKDPSSQQTNSNMSSKSSKSKKKKKVNLLEVLKDVPLVSSLTSDERVKLSKGLKQAKYKKGDYLTRQGEEGDSFFIVVEGKVNVTTLSNGKEEIVAVLEPGDYAGEQALLQNAKRNASLQAASDNVKCFVCSQKVFKNVLANNTSIKFAKREAKRKAFMTAINYDEIKDDEKDSKIPEKTISWLLDCVEENLLFKQLSIKQQKNVLSRMRLITVKHGQFVINQGILCDFAYIYHYEHIQTHN